MIAKRISTVLLGTALITGTFSIGTAFAGTPTTFGGCANQVDQPQLLAPGRTGTGTFVIDANGVGHYPVAFGGGQGCSVAP